MPLRDHFHPPLDAITSWDLFHGQWPAMIVQELSLRLPPGYSAGPHVYLGKFAEVDVAAFDSEQDSNGSYEREGGEGGVVTAVWAPAKPTLTLETGLAEMDEYEVRIYDMQRGRTLVAAIEIVSPANKDRPEHRRAFVTKCAALLQNHVAVSIVDLVTNRSGNHYRELLDYIGQPGQSPTALSSIYAVSCRRTDRRSGKLEVWEHTLAVGQPLPTLPIWISDRQAVPLDLESCYETTCRVLRIP
jgi:hypothetical protein